MHTAAENLKEIVASTLNSLCWWMGHQTYWGVFAWTRGTQDKHFLNNFTFWEQFMEHCWDILLNKLRI